MAPRFLQTETDWPPCSKLFRHEPMQRAVAACGLALAAQEPWECLASFILSSTKQSSKSANHRPALRTIREPLIRPPDAWERRRPAGQQPHNEPSHSPADASAPKTLPPARLGKGLVRFNESILFYAFPTPQRSPQRLNPNCAPARWAFARQIFLRLRGKSPAGILI